MADKKLPEQNIGEGEIVDLAAELVQVRADKAKLDTKEKDLRTKIEKKAVAFRDQKLDKNKIVGLIRITDDRAPIRVEFRVSSKDAALDPDEEQTLDDLFRGLRPLLFGKDTIISEITEPEELLTAMRESGRNPWDFLKLSVKSGMDEVVSSYPYTISSTVFMPKEGFLATLSDVFHTLTESAGSYIKQYIKAVVKPTVVAGSRGKA